MPVLPLCADSRYSVATPMKAPKLMNSPCEKFSVLVVVKVMLKLSAISA